MAKKAKEAAEQVNKNPEISVKRVRSVIPDYKLQLHRNQWIATFFKHLAPDLHDQFAALKNTGS